MKNSQLSQQGSKLHVGAVTGLPPLQLLANIALEMGGRIEWDAKKEVITNNEKANELLHYDYREPWDLKTLGSHY